MTEETKKPKSAYNGVRRREGKSGVLSYGLYGMYKERFKGVDRRSEANVPYEVWLRVCKTFNLAKMDSIIDGHIFVMPFRLGRIGIIEFKRKIKFNEDGTLSTKGLIVDWNKTLQLWAKIYPECKTIDDYKKIKGKQVVYMTNEHTDGRIFKFHWNRRGSIIRNITAYKFVVPRQHKEKLSRKVFANPNIQYCKEF